MPDPRAQSVVSVGAAGDAGCAEITTFADAGEVHWPEFVTLKVYVPAGIPDIVVLVPVPVLVTSPGVRVTAHVPVDGSPDKITLPVGNTQVGWVIVPTTGAVGLVLTVNR